MVIRLQGFSGEIPRTEPYYLPEQAAAAAMNAVMRSGALQPFRQPSPSVFTFSDDRTSICLHGADWLGWDHDTDAVPGPVAQDRLYITHSNAQPTMRISGAEVPLALPKPTTRPTIGVSGTVNADEAEYVAYAYTWVTSLGEETAPSPLSGSALWSAGCTVNLTGLPSAVPVPDRYISGKRIYRAITSSSGATDLYFIAEIAASAVSYDHDIVSAPVAEAITTKEFDAVPTNLRGLTAMPNGIMAGFRGKELLFSEPYQPHAWPGAYRLATNDVIIGLAAFGSSLAVLTTGLPYVVQGLHPDAMAMEKMEQPFPCMSKRGIVDMGYAAIYPSTDGLVQVTQQGAQLISAALWTREQWLGMQPTTMIAARFASLYGVSYVPASGGARRMAFIDPQNPQGGVIRSDETASGLFTHVESGITYLLGNDNRGVRAFDDPGMSKKAYIWRSKPWRLPVPQSFGAIRIETDGAVGETVTAHLYADGNLFHSISARDMNARLPDGAHRTWQVELTGNATVLSVQIGRTFAEIAA